MILSEKEILDYRLVNHQLSVGNYSTPAGLLEWMGAIQAQDRQMANWALGLRLKDKRLNDIQQSYDQGEIVRTHVLRPTWHMVPARDIHWMLALTAPGIKSGINSRQQQLELDTKTLNRCTELIIGTLKENPYQTREQLMQLIQRENISTDLNRSSHILMHAELEGLICSGPLADDKPTYSLLEHVVAKPVLLTHEESLAELTKRYFRSHGPATLADFCWWSGLGIKMARNGIELNRNGMISARNGRDEYFMFDTMLPISKTVFALPAFDEYLISYKDRKELLPDDMQKNVISSNGIFYPLILQEGKVIGKWSRKQQKQAILIQLQLSKTPSVRLKKEIKEQFEMYGEFCGQNVKIEY
jgi:hypothetical protein